MASLCWLLVGGFFPWGFLAQAAWGPSRHSGQLLPERAIQETKEEAAEPFTIPGGSYNLIYDLTSKVSYYFHHILDHIARCDSVWEETTQECKYQQVGWLVAILELTIPLFSTGPSIKKSYLIIVHLINIKLFNNIWVYYTFLTSFFNFLFL